MIYRKIIAILNTIIIIFIETLTDIIEMGVNNQMILHRHLDRIVRGHTVANEVLARIVVHIYTCIQYNIRHSTILYIKYVKQLKT